MQLAIHVYNFSFYVNVHFISGWLYCTTNLLDYLGFIRHLCAFLWISPPRHHHAATVTYSSSLPLNAFKLCSIWGDVKTERCTLTPRESYTFHRGTIKRCSCSASHPSHLAPRWTRCIATLLAHDALHLNHRLFMLVSHVTSPDIFSFA